MEPESGDEAPYSTSKRSSNVRRRKSTLHNREIATLGSQATCQGISANVALSAPSGSIKILANGIGKSSYESLCKPLSICIPRLSETIIQKVLHKISTKPLKRRRKPAWKHGKTSNFKKRKDRFNLPRRILQKHSKRELSEHSNVGGNQQNIASMAPKEKSPIKLKQAISNSVKKKQESQSTVTPTKQRKHMQSRKSINKKIQRPHSTITKTTPSKQTRLTQFMVPSIKNIEDNSTVSNAPPTKQKALVQSNIRKGLRKKYSPGKKIEKDPGSVPHVTPTKQTKQTELVQSASPISKSSRKETGSVKKAEKNHDIVTSVTPTKQTKQTTVVQSTPSIIKMSRKEHSAIKNVTPVKQPSLIQPASSLCKSVEKVDSTVKNVPPHKEVPIIEPMSKFVKQEYNVIVNVTPIKQIPSIQSPTNDLMCAAEEEIIDVETIPTEDLSTIGSPQVTSNDGNNEKTIVTSTNKHLSPAPQTLTPMVKIPICSLELSWSEITNSSIDVEEAQAITTHTPSEDLGNCSGAMLQDPERSKSKNLSDDSNGWKFRRKRNISAIDNIDSQKIIKKRSRHVMWADEEAAKDIVSTERTSTKGDPTERSNELVETQDSIKGDEGLITTKKLQIPLLKLEDMLEHPLVKKWHLQKTKYSSEIEQSDGVDTHSHQHTKLIIKKSGTSTYTSRIVTDNESSISNQQDKAPGQCVNKPLAVEIREIPEVSVPIPTPATISVDSENLDCTLHEEENKKPIDSTEHVEHTEITKHAKHIEHSDLSGKAEIQSNTNNNEKISAISEETSRFNDAIVVKYNLIKNPKVLLWRLEDLGVSFITNSVISATEVERLTEAYTSSLTNNKLSENSLTDRLLVDDNTNASDDSSDSFESSESGTSTPKHDSTTVWSDQAKAYLSSMLKRKTFAGRRKPKRIIKVVTRLPKSLRTTKKDTIGNAMIYETLKESLANKATSKRSKLPTIISSEILRGSNIVSTDTALVETLVTASSPAKESQTSQDASKLSTDKSVHEQKEMLNVWKTAFLSVDDKKMASGFGSNAESRVWKHHTISSPSASETDQSPSTGSNSTKQSTSAQRSVTTTPVKRKKCETESPVSEDKSPNFKLPPVKKHSSSFNRTGVYTCTECNQWYIDFEKLKKHFTVCERLKSKQLSAAQQRVGPRFTKLLNDSTNEQSTVVKSVESSSDTLINTENEASLGTEISSSADEHEKLGITPDTATEMPTESVLESTVDESTCSEESILASDTNVEFTTRSSPRKKHAKKTVKPLIKRRLRQMVDHLTCNVCQWTADSKTELFDHVYKHTEKELQDVYNRSISKMHGADQIQSNEESTSEIDNSATMSSEETSSEKACDPDKQSSTPVDKSKYKLTKEQASDRSHTTTSENGLDATPTKASTSEKAIAKTTDIPEDKLKLVSKTSPTISLSKLIVICECHKNEGLSVNHVSNTDALQIEINLFCRICRVLFRRIECFETHYRKSNSSLCNQDRMFGRSPRLFCNSCRVVLSSVTEMRRHLEMHFRRNRNGTVSFVCNLCKVIFIGIGEFYSHWTSHSKNPMYIATAFSFRKSSLVPQEQFIGTLLNDDKVKEKYIIVAEYVCRDCKAVFELQTELIAHEPDCRRRALMLAANKAARNTTIQNESQMEPSTSQQASARPRKMIPKPRKFRLICGLCNMNFIEEDAFQKHEQEHRKTLSKPQYYCIPTKTKNAFLCKACVNIYDDFSTLEKHWVKHSKICKDYICVLCDKRFKSKTLFEEHTTDKTCNVQSADNEEYRSCRVEYFDTSFICKNCDECFTDGRGLTEHMTTFHKDPPSDISNTEQANKCVTRKSLPTSSPTGKLPNVRKSLDIQVASTDITKTLPANSKSSVVSSLPRLDADSASSSHSSSTSTKNVIKDTQSTPKKNTDSGHTNSLPKPSSRSTPQSAECAEKQDDDDNESDSEGKLVIELPETDDENDNTVKTVEEKADKGSSPRTVKESPEKNRSNTNAKGDDSDSGPELIILDDAESNLKKQPRVIAEIKGSPGKSVGKSAQVNGGKEESTSTTGSVASNDASKETGTAPPKKGFIRVKTLAELGQRIEQYACTSCTRSFNTQEELTTHQWEVHSFDAIDELLRDLTEDPQEPIETIIQLPNTNTNGSTNAGTNVSLVKPCYVRQRAQPAQETSGQQQQSQNGQITARSLPYTVTYQHQQQQSEQKQRPQRQQQPQQQPQQQSQQAIARPIGGRPVWQGQQQQQHQQQQQLQQQDARVVQDAAVLQPQVRQRPHVRVHSARDFYKAPQKYTSPLQHFVTYVQPMPGANTPPSSNLPVFTTQSIVTTTPANTTQTHANKPTPQPNINPQSNLTQLQANINPTPTNTGQAQINKFVLQPNINPAQSNVIQVQASIHPTQGSITQVPSGINSTQSTVPQLQTSMNRLQSNVSQLRPNNTVPMQPNVIAVQSVMPPTVYTQQHSQQGQYFFTTRRGEPQIQHPENTVVSTHYSTQSGPTLYWGPIVPNYNSSTTYVNSAICDVPGQQLESKQKVEFVTQNNAQASGYQVSISGTGAGNVAGTETSNQTAMAPPITFDQLTIRQQYPLLGTGGTTIHVNNLTNDPVKCITIQPTMQPQQQLQQQQQQQQ